MLPGSSSLQSRYGPIGHLTGSDSVDRPQRAPRDRKKASDDGGGDAGAEGRRSIRQVQSFAELYDLGKEVMPSTHNHMEVRFATRKADGVQAVVKLRLKPKCFKSREHERSWRRSTEFLLNVPEYCGVARLHDVIEDSLAFYIVMERVDGLDLFESLDAGRFDKETTRTIVKNLMVSLVHMHSHNAIHKDLKLENVILEGGGKVSFEDRTDDANPIVKIIDFDTVEEWTPGAPLSKDVVGTDQYIPQEAYAGRYSPLSDIFSIGVLAYRLICGRFPFHDGIFDDGPGENWVGGPKMDQIRRRLKVAKLDFNHSAFRHDPEATDLVARMLASDPRQRLSAMAALEHPWLRGPADDAGGDVWKYDYARNELEDLVDDGIIIAD